MKVREAKHANCAVCGRYMSLHTNGTVRSHVRYTGRRSVRCDGTSKPPKAEVKP